MDNLLMEVIETNLRTQKQARDLNVRAGERIFPIMSRLEKKAWLMGKLQGARSVAEIKDLDSLFLPALDIAIIEKIMAENPDTVEVEGETLGIKYEQDWNNNFICSIEISEEFVRQVRIEKLYLPGGRNVRLLCGSYSADSIPELVEKLEKYRIKKSWEEKRRELERTSWISNPRDVVPYLSQLLFPVEIFQTMDGKSTLGWPSLFSDSDPDFQIRLRESKEEAEKETRIGLERLLRKDCKNVFVVPEEEPWQSHSSYHWRKTSVGEVLEQKLGEIIASVLEGLSSETYAEKVERAKQEIEGVKNSLQTEYISFENAISENEKALYEEIYSIFDRFEDFVKFEISQAKDEMERARKLLDEMKYREAANASTRVWIVSQGFEILAEKRKKLYDQASSAWHKVGEYVYDLSEGKGIFREATESERERAEKIQDDIREALENNNFDFVFEKVPKIKAWVESVSALCSEREQDRRKKYPEGVWEAACGCNSDNSDEIADKGIELAKACSDLVGEKNTLYSLRSMTKGNMSKYEKQSRLLELVNGLEENEAGKWFNNLHYADDINSAIQVGIAFLESESTQKISKKDKDEEGKEEVKGEKIEDLVSQLAAAFGGANVKIKTKNQKVKSSN